MSSLRTVLRTRRTVPTRGTARVNRACCLVLVVAACFLGSETVDAELATQREAGTGCEDVAPVLFTPSPATLDLALDAGTAQADGGNESGEAAPDDGDGATSSTTAPQGGSNGDARDKAVFYVSLSPDPPCELPVGAQIQLAHSVPLSGPASSTKTPIITTGDVTFTETVSFNGVVEAVGTIALPDLKPGAWTGTLSLVFRTGSTTEASVIGSASLPLTIRNQQDLTEGFPFSPLALMLLAAIGGLALGVYRMLSATENPDQIALFRRSEDRPIGIPWGWRNAAAVAFAAAAGFMASSAVYWRNRAFVVDLDSSIALFGAVGGAVVAAFVAAFRAPNASNDDVKKARAELTHRTLEVQPDHAAAGKTVLLKGSALKTGTVCFGSEEAVRQEHFADDLVSVEVPHLGPEVDHIVISVIEQKTGKHLVEVPFKYDGFGTV